MSDWATRVYEAVDRKDTDAYVDFLAEDVWFRFANAEPLHGREAVREALYGFFAGMQSLSHDTHHEYRVDDTVILVADVTYTRLDGAQVTVPAVTIYELDGEVATRCQIFVDLAPLWAPSDSDAAVAGTTGA